MRQIFIVNATQVVTSEAHPEGLFSVMTGFPKTFDSVRYDGNNERAMMSARSAYYDQLSKNYANTNENRVMATITLEIANGQQILRECIGAFPDMTPVPEPTPEPEEVSKE